MTAEKKLKPKAPLDFVALAAQRVYAEFEKQDRVVEPKTFGRIVSVLATHLAGCKTNLERERTIAFLLEPVAEARKRAHSASTKAR